MKKVDHLALRRGHLVTTPPMPDGTHLGKRKQKIFGLKNLRFLKNVVEKWPQKWGRFLAPVLGSTSIVGILGGVRKAAPFWGPRFGPSPFGWRQPAQKTRKSRLSAHVVFGAESAQIGSARNSHENWFPTTRSARHRFWCVRTSMTNTSAQRYAQDLRSSW